MDRTLLAAAFLAVSLATGAAAGDLQVVVEVETSLGIKAGDPVISSGKRIGRVTDVGFGESDTVDVSLEIDEEHRDLVREASTFVISENPDGARTIEHYVIDEQSPPAEPGARFQGARSLAEVWLRRGRIDSEELGRAMSKGFEAFRRSIDQLKQSKEWPKFRDQLARLAAQFTVMQDRLAKMLEQELPKLQGELDSLYREYEREIDRQRSEAKPAPEKKKY